MLNIDYNLYDHIKSTYPDRELKEHIYWVWQPNRYIQISTPLNDINVHYEYINGQIELHFEGEDCEKKYNHLIDFLMQETENNENFIWEDWSCGYKCQFAHTIESLGELDETVTLFITKFDNLFNEFTEYRTKSCYTNLEQEDILSFQKDIVEIHELTLEKLLKLPLTIPDYQRIYCWGENNVKCLLEDIFNHIECQGITGHQYRLGTVILHHNIEKYDIIDGQQRLVTLSLLLYELGKYPNLLDEKFASKESHAYISYNKYLIKSFLLRHPRDNKKLISGLLNYLDFSVLVLQNASLDLAYTFFSNQNSRGVGLTDYDLLKAHHLRFIPQVFEQQSMRAAETWNQMIEDGRPKLEAKEKPDYVNTLDTYIYHLRKWMRKNECEDGNERNRIKREFEAAPIINEIPPFGEKFYFNEPIQGGTHFFSFVEQHLLHYKHYARTKEVRLLHNKMAGGSNQWYRDVIEALLFGYYLKFGEFCLADALIVIMRIILQHRYNSGRAKKASIIQYAGDMKVIFMIDQATSPTFFLAETQNIAKELFYPPIRDLSPIRRGMKQTARNIAKELDKEIVIKSFKNLNL